MADGILRTPAIGLSYTSDEVMNRNLDRIDAAFATLIPDDQTYAAKVNREKEELEKQRQEASGEEQPTPAPDQSNFEPKPEP